MSTDSRRITVPKFVSMKAAGKKITMATAYDFPMARLLDEAGVDALLVGDSLAMVVQGHENTLPATLDQMIYHAEMVGRGAINPLIIVDLPFPCDRLGSVEAVRAASRILKETRCQAVKLEGGENQAEVIAGLVAAGIPVMAHCGLRPQSVHQLGGYGVQRDRERLLNDAKSAQQAGAFAVLLECIPTAIAAEITAQVSIPTIGIGAGPHCDGQVLVLHDLIGLTIGRVPRHVKTYAHVAGVVREAVGRYCAEVRSGVFPGPEHSFD